MYIISIRYAFSYNIILSMNTPPPSNAQMTKVRV